MKEKDLKMFSDKIIAEGDGITKVEIFINGEKKWLHHAIPVTERIKTYEDACWELGIPITPERCKGMTEDELAYCSLKVITRALNEGWKPDWSNQDQGKWYPWFKVTGTNPAGLACSNTLNPVSTTTAYFGSRLCFKTEALAEYAGTQFKELYEKYLL